MSIVFRRGVLILLAFVVYVGSYVALSRHGFAVSDQAGITGFWFFELRPTDAWEVSNYGCVAFYAPLIYLDYHFVGKRQPANVPLMGLSKGDVLACL